MQDVERDLPEPDPRKANQVPQIHLHWLGLVRNILTLPRALCRRCFLPVCSFPGQWRPPLSLSWGAWKDLSPLPQGHRLQRVGVGIGIRGQELGHESNAAAAEAESGMPQRQKTAPLGTHGDSELGSSTKGLIRGPPGALLLQTLQPVCFFLGAGLRCSGPPSPTRWAAHQLLPIKTFPFKTLSALLRQGQGQAQPF